LTYFEVSKGKKKGVQVGRGGDRIPRRGLGESLGKSCVLPWGKRGKKRVDSPQDSEKEGDETSAG